MTDETTKRRDVKHSPTPWRVEHNRQEQRRFILEAGNHVLGACWGNYWDFPDGNTDESDKRAEADAVYIVEAVNAHERLVAENARLRDLVRRMGDEMEDLKNCLVIASAISGATRDADSEARVDALLAEARAALEDGEETANG